MWGVESGRMLRILLSMTLAAALIAPAAVSAKATPNLGGLGGVHRFLPAAQAGAPPSNCKTTSFVFEQDHAPGVFATARTDCTVLLADGLAGYRLCATMTAALHAAVPATVRAADVPARHRRCMRLTVRKLTVRQGARRAGVRPARCERRDRWTVVCRADGERMRVQRATTGRVVAG